MKMKITFFCLSIFCLSISAFSQTSEGLCKDVNGVCVFTLEPKDEYKTPGGAQVGGVKMEQQFKVASVKETPCNVRVWTKGSSTNKIYQNLTAYKTPIEIRKKENRKLIVNFQYVGQNDDAAVVAFGDVVFVDHAFTVYLIMPDHNCHGLPTSPTQYYTCGLCGKQYKAQQFYNEYTDKNLTIYIGANGCDKSQTGYHDNRQKMDDVPACPKLDQPECDQVIKGGDINK